MDSKKGSMVENLWNVSYMFEHLVLWDKRFKVNGGEKEEFPFAGGGWGPSTLPSKTKTTKNYWVVKEGKLRRGGG